VIDILVANAERTERQNRPTAANLQAARSIGAVALLTPPAYGDSSVNATNIVRLIAELARGCPSTAWLASTSMVAKT
jgi:alkylation response protein AidB-like acyl-CoA dehydrogenase